MNATERRILLLRTGYVPVPLFGKIPPLRNWQALTDVSCEQVEMWAKTWPDARNTGALTARMPAFDVDIVNDDAARAVEELVRDRFDEAGVLMTRIGRAPKRAFLFRTAEVFDKIAVNVVDRNGKAGEKLEFLGDGQQVVLFGIHPQTGKPYQWHGGEPGGIKREDLPYIRQDEAQALIEAVAGLLVRDFGYRPAPTRHKRRKGNGGEADEAQGDAVADWQFLTDNVQAGRQLHDSLRDLAAKMIASGMNAGAAVNALRALIDGATCPHDERWRERRAEIPELVDSAVEKYATAPEPGPPKPALPPAAIDDTLKVFQQWLLLTDHTPVLAVLGAIAANYLPGDPVWLALIAPPSSAKTEILNATAGLPHVVQAATMTPAGLLSGSPKKQQAKGAKGGLLQQIGGFGILVLKDFGSILSMHTETRAETLAALREIFDGSWTRHVGSDGGRTLHWKGKVALITAATGVIDTHYSVIGAMGDRFLFSRLAPTKGQAQFKQALKHAGATTQQMRTELAEAVARLFAGRRPEPQPISPDEIQSIGEAISLVVRLRGAVERDRRSREVEAIYGAEGTARIGLALERLLAGLDTLGVERSRALGVVLAVALNSVPPLRRAAYDVVCVRRTVETTDVAAALGLPTITARRVLEDLAAYGLVTRKSQGQGKADLWERANWEAEQ